MSVLNYLAQGYFDDQGRLRKEIYLDWAQAVANQLSADKMSTAALRRFYAQIKGLQPLLADADSFERNKHRLYPLIPLANYGVNKEEANLPFIFKEFIEKNISLAEKDYKHFLAFVEHFQSVVAYFKEPNQKRNS